MKKRLMVLLVTLLTISLLVAGCAPAAEPVEEAAEEEAAEEPAEEEVAEEPAEEEVAEEPAEEELPPAPEFIEIAASMPMTGKYASLGEMVLPGYEYAIEDINAAGGVYVEEYGVSIPLRFTYYDDESDPTKAVNNMETLFAELEPTVYLGGAGSDMHAATAAIAELHETPYLGVAFALWQIHQQGYQYLFSPFPKSPNQANDVFEIINTLIPEDERPTKVAVFQETTDWGIELGGLWQKFAEEHGFEIVYYGEYAPRVGDFSQMILDAQASEAEILLAVPSPPDGADLVGQMEELGWAPKFSLIIRAPEAITWAESMGTAGDYITIFPGWHNAMDFPGVDELNAKYEEDFGRPADLLTGPAYSCVQIIADAIERAGTLDRAAVRDAIADTDMTTVIGPVTFNEDGTGNVLNPMVQWQNGQLELVWPEEQASAELLYPALPYEER